MSEEHDPPQEKTPELSRRRFLAIGGGALAAGAAFSPAALAASAVAAPHVAPASNCEPFWGTHQGGILTAQQKHTYFAAFDLQAESRDDVIALLRSWTSAAARLTAGQCADDLGTDVTTTPGDGGAALGLSPQRLTLTFGFGPGLFESNGVDRYGLKARRPDALIDLPRFPTDQLIDGRTGGDLSVQACADDPQVAFHAVRELNRLAYGTANIRWSQTGFIPNSAPAETPRNLMGFKDGTNNPSTTKPSDMETHVWVGPEGPAWMRGGSYVVMRRIRIALEHWDRMRLDFQEQAVGRHKYSGAPIGGKTEFEEANYDATDKDGNPIIPDTAHIRLAAPVNNGGTRILRRGYSYNDGVTFTSERWPPWHQGMEYDSGLLFVAYQKDPRTGFVKIFDQMSKLDMLNQFFTHTGSGLFACPPGVGQGGYIGDGLFEVG